jgi:hypothetical protein
VESAAAGYAELWNCVISEEAVRGLGRWLQMPWQRQQKILEHHGTNLDYY